MKKQKKSGPDHENLRQKAEALLNTSNPINIRLTNSNATQAETLKLYQELKVYQAEQAQLKIRARYDELVRHIPVGIYTMHIHPGGVMNFDYVSVKFCEMLGVEEKDALRDPGTVFCAIHPDDYPSMVEANRIVSQTFQPFRWKGRCRIWGEMGWIRIESEPTVLPDGGSLWNGVIFDNTEQKLAEETIRVMGGDIAVSSQVGTGSIFTVHVEIKEGPTNASEPISAKRVISLDNNHTTYRILVVDDKQENLQVVVNLLKMVGFETNEAVNGKDAIEKSGEWDPDLILMDLRMPVMDGYEAIRRIKLTEKGSKTPIIALTASTFDGDRKKISEMGIQGYICKPFREDELFSTIGNILGITYIYEDETPSSLTKYLNNEEAIAGDIAKLPDALKLQLQEAAAVADLNQLLKLITTIEPEHTDLAQQLMILAKNYDYEHLQRVLGK